MVRASGGGGLVADGLLESLSSADARKRRFGLDAVETMARLGAAQRQALLDAGALGALMGVKSRAGTRSEDYAGASRTIALLRQPAALPSAAERLRRALADGGGSIKRAPPTPVSATPLYNTQLRVAAPSATAEGVRAATEAEAERAHFDVISAIRRADTSTTPATPVVAPTPMATLSAVKSYGAPMAHAAPDARASAAPVAGPPDNTRVRDSENASASADGEDADALASIAHSRPARENAAPKTPSEHLNAAVASAATAVERLKHTLPEGAAGREGKENDARYVNLSALPNATAERGADAAVSAGAEAACTVADAEASKERTMTAQIAALCAELVRCKAAAAHAAAEAAARSQSELSSVRNAAAAEREAYVAAHAEKLDACERALEESRASCARFQADAHTSREEFAVFASAAHTQVASLEARLAEVTTEAKDATESARARTKELEDARLGARTRERQAAQARAEAEVMQLKAAEREEDLFRQLQNAQKELQAALSDRNQALEEASNARHSGAQMRAELYILKEEQAATVGEIARRAAEEAATAAADAAAASDAAWMAKLTRERESTALRVREATADMRAEVECLRTELAAADERLALAVADAKAKCEEAKQSEAAAHARKKAAGASVGKSDANAATANEEVEALRKEVVSLREFKEEHQRMLEQRLASEEAALQVAAESAVTAMERLRVAEAQLRERGVAPKSTTPTRMHPSQRTQVHSRAQMSTSMPTVPGTAPLTGPIRPRALFGAPETPTPPHTTATPALMSTAVVTPAASAFASVTSELHEGLAAMREELREQREQTAELAQRLPSASHKAEEERALGALRAKVAMLGVETASASEEERTTQAVENAQHAIAAAQMTLKKAQTARKPEGAEAAKR